MEQSDSKFREIFEKSPIGILFFDKGGNLTDANQSTLEILGIPSLEDVKGIDLFDDINIGPKRDELLDKGLIKLQSSVNFDNIKKLGIYIPKKLGTAFIDLTVFVIDSGFLAQIQDITDRKKAEEAVIDSKNKYRALFETMLQGVVYQNADGNITSINPAAERIMGYGLDEIKCRTSSDPIWEAIHEDGTDFPGEEHPAMVALKTGRKIRDVVMGIRNPGTNNYTWINIDAVPEFKPGEKKPYQVYTTFEDITERKRIAEELEASNEDLHATTQEIYLSNYELQNERNKLENILDSMNDGVIIINQHYEIEYLNPAMRENFGEHDGRKCYEYLYKEEGVCSKCHIPKIFKGKSTNRDVYFPDSRRTYNVFNTPLKNVDGSIFVLQIFHDITQRKRVEMNLRESEEISNQRLAEIEAIYDSAPIGLCVFDRKLRYVRINKRLAEINGVSVDEHIGKTPREVVPDLADLAEEIADKIFDTGEPVLDIELSGTTPANLHVVRTWIEQWVPLKGGKGKIVGINLAVLDITEFKSAQKELKESHDHLEEKVEERTAEIEEAYQTVKENELKLKDAIAALEHSNRELQSFAYITSHDLQEPLRTIASFSQLIERRYKGHLDSDADEFLDFISSAAKRMKEMIQGLLEYSRIDRVEKEFTKTDMNVKVEKAVSSLHTAIEESSAEVTYDPLPTVIADPDQMVRVFQNFIANAIKFKKPQFPPKVHIKADMNIKLKEWIFSVEDNGIGMEEQYSDRIFEVFKRLHTIDEYEGTGIGLAIIKRIIERHGGRIWVESEFGGGSTFYFTVPFKPPELGGGGISKISNISQKPFFNISLNLNLLAYFKCSFSI